MNRGYRYRKKPKDGDTGRKDPQFYVFPVEIVRAAQDPHSKWGKAFLSRIENPAEYLANWGIVKAFLDLEGNP